MSLGSSEMPSVRNKIDVRQLVAPSLRMSNAISNAAGKLVPPAAVSASTKSISSATLRDVAATSSRSKQESSTVDEKATTDTNEEGPNVCSTLITACLASSIRFAVFIDPDVSIRITTSLLPLAADTYHGRKRGS